jgi:membrane fusion protein (multidrug efflux system)
MRKILTTAALLALAACSNADGRTRERPDPVVKLAPVASDTFVQTLEAVGTARANEQVTLSAPVTDRVIELNFSDGGFVRKGQIVAVLARGQEQAQLAEAQARASEAQKQLERLEELKRRGFATTAAYDAQTAVAQSARAQAAQARAAIGDRVLRAPFSGFVSLRNISEGAIVQAGAEVATISDLGQIKLDFTVPETMLATVRAGQSIEAKAAAYPDQRFSGRVQSIDPVINPQTRAATVRAVLPNPGRKLLPGMLLTVSVASAARQALAVPELAVVGEGERSYVFTVNNGVARRVPVEVGVRDGQRVEVLSGLRRGQPIVVEGVVKISDGQKVRVAGGATAARGAQGS